MYYMLGYLLNMLAPRVVNWTQYSICTIYVQTKINLTVDLFSWEFEP